ncbi:hypothetical protein [Lacunimicrobium album]
MEEMQELVLEVLLRGGSVAIAAGQAEVSVHEVYRWLEEDEAFARRYRNVMRALDQNVIAKIYQEAMQGSLPALSLWVKEREPVDWKRRDEETTVNWEGMDDGELREIVFRAVNEQGDRSLAGDPSSAVSREPGFVSKKSGAAGA